MRVYKKEKMFSPDLSIRVTALLIVFIFMLLAGVGFLFLRKQHEDRRVRLVQQEGLIEQRRLLEEESDRLDQIAAIVDQPQYIESVARNELGMIQEDEIIFKDVP